MTHELSLMAALIRQVETVALEKGAVRVVGISVRLGALTHISPTHFREHWEQATSRTIAHGASLDVEIGDDVGDPHAQDILLSSVELEFASTAD